ncbi:competence protein CoiA [Pedobacter sp. AJM]|uniref:competence protein CoiA n=1 Tax=Pedobacter sp. AJM TaxID=2003629 RepID=UPI000B4BE000|nr:competence protein CoiA family protein [Pedobacter sp. AJM]OWK71439.1 hypothetical protein CBW18_10315 [Pedobacter sp. AJM]
MHYALVDNNRIKVQSNLTGLCPGCSQIVIAKCGTQRVHHWAHKNGKNCDKWWESETEWHRLWKDNYPAEWQESFSVDQESGEIHIADVRTSAGLVIEFQHSNIMQQERESRERFYQNMVWVVNGLRLKNDYKRFNKRITYQYLKEPNIFGVYDIENFLPVGWSNSSISVIFDFNGIDSSENCNDAENFLYCLIPKRVGRIGILIK